MFQAVERFCGGPADCWEGPWDFCGGPAETSQAVGQIWEGPAG